METLARVQQLKTELDGLRPFKPELEARIWQKFRLDWNYHSNKLEGNTYSFGETKMLLLRERTAGGKPKRDSDEILGHDQAINFILESIEQEEPLSERFIRHLHKLILVKPFWSEAETADGVPTKRLVKVGEYKSEPNHVKILGGEVFYFAEPIETPAEMAKLVEWGRTNIESLEVNPILFAAEFHYRFVRIHPFDDGNGRMARLLMNFLLMKLGYPPVIILNEDKEDYIAVLEQADFNILEPFVNFIGKQMVRSLEIMISGANGEDIEEPQDLDKELLFLEKKLEIVGNRVGEIKAKTSVLNVFDHSIAPLLDQLSKALRKFDKLYRDPSVEVEVQGGDLSYHELVGPNLVEEIRRVLSAATNTVRVTFSHSALIQIASVQSFSNVSHVQVDFQPQFYVVKVHLNVLQKKYTEFLTSGEIDGLVRFLANRHKDAIDKVIKAVEQRLP